MTYYFLHKEYIQNLSKKVNTGTLKIKVKTYEQLHTFIKINWTVCQSRGFFFKFSFPVQTKYTVFVCLLRNEDSALLNNIYVPSFIAPLFCVSADVGMFSQNVFTWTIFSYYIYSRYSCLAEESIFSTSYRVRKFNLE